MKKEALSKRILDLIKLFRASIDIEGGNVKIQNDKKDHFNNLWSSIIEDLMWEPGKLIYVKDKSELPSYKTMIDIMWHTLDAEQIFNELTDGGYSGLLVDIVGNYIDRAKLIKPILINFDPKIENFNIFFNEAMKSYFYGLNKAALILCCSIFENILKKKLKEVDNSLVYNLSKKNGREIVTEFSLKKLINNAATIKLITYKEKKTAHDIRELRNGAVHKMLNISSDQTYKAIIDSKSLIEILLVHDHAVNI